MIHAVTPHRLVRGRTASSRTASSCTASGWRRAGWLALLAVLAALLGGCAEASKADAVEDCRALLDLGEWDDAITTCEAIDSATGRSLAAQAYMGRAGLSLLDLLDSLGSTNLDGLALILDVFTVTVGSAEFTDADAAISLLLTNCNAAAGCSDTDYFNLTIASDVLLTSLLLEHLSISVNTTTGAVTVPGVTDTGIETLTNPQDSAAVQSVFDAMYTTAGSYYTTTPLAWQNATADVDLERISTYVRANRVAVAGLDLGDLSALDFSAQIDNGQCGYATGVNAGNPGTATPDADQVAQLFPRRLNTSDSTAARLAVELEFVLTTSGTTDTTKEWGGEFRLPSALLNPDFLGVSCTGAAAALGAFSTCMANAQQNATDFTALTEDDLTTAIACDGACNHFPVIGGDGSVLGDLNSTDTANLTAAKADLNAVLNQLYPIDNTVTASITGTRPAYACASGDGLVHYREYDYYLRGFGTQ